MNKFVGIIIAGIILLGGYAFIFYTTPFIKKIIVYIIMLLMILYLLGKGIKYLKENGERY